MPPREGVLVFNYKMDKRIPSYDWQRNTTTTEAETERIIAQVRANSDKASVLELSLGHELFNVEWMGCYTDALMSRARGCLRDGLGRLRAAQRTGQAARYPSVVSRGPRLVP